MYLWARSVELLYCLGRYSVPSYQRPLSFSVHTQMDLLGIQPKLWVREIRALSWLCSCWRTKSEYYTQNKTFSFEQHWTSAKHKAPTVKETTDNIVWFRGRYISTFLDRPEWCVCGLPKILCLLFAMLLENSVTMIFFLLMLIFLNYFWSLNHLLISLCAQPSHTRTCIHDTEAVECIVHVKSPKRDSIHNDKNALKFLIVDTLHMMDKQKCINFNV